jgi:uncharacterized protein (TIGR03437 family)
MRLLLLTLAAAVPMLAQCSYTLNISTYNIAAGSSGVSPVNGPAIVVTAGDGCKWTPSVTAAWLHLVYGQTGGTGSSPVGWFADRNTVPTSRTGNIVITGQNPATTLTVAITQAAANCTYTITPQSASIPVGGGTGSAQVQTGCSWGAATAQPWITVPANTGGTIDGPISYTVAPNTCVGGRSGAIVAGLPGSSSTQYQTTLQISQDGSAANFTLSPQSLSLSSDAADGRVVVTTGAGCAWTATSDVSWIQLSSGSMSGSGNGSVTYHILANTSSTRVGNIHFGNQLFVVTQQGPAAPVPQLSAVTNAASGLQGAVSPGEIVSLFGSNLGPAPAATLQLTPDGRSITKTLGGVQVLFDGTPAPLTYAGAGQVNAVVPYGLAGKSSTNVQVQYQGQSTAPLALAVQASTPGLFTQDGSGLGLGAILNQDFSLNGPANRAARGDVVMIYCTGGGATSPDSVDASVAVSPLPMLTLPVSVTIGNIDAHIFYQGAAPGSIAGLTQINAQIPAGVTPGAGVPIVVRIGDYASQTGVTLAVE